MPLMREKHLNVLGVDVTLAMEAQRAEALTRGRLWRRVVRPSLQIARRGLGRLRGGARPGPGDEAAVTTTTVGSDGSTLALTPQEPRVRPTAADDALAAALRERATGIAWYHTIDLPHGVTVQGVVDYRGQVTSHGIPIDLTGKRCLDVGTFDGFWAFEMEKRGAAEVVGLDIDSLADMDFPRRKRQALVDEAMQQRGTMDVGQGFLFAHEVLGSTVKRVLCNVYDLAPEKVGGRFDLVFISDVLVHLRDPQTALENIFSVMNPGGIFLLATAYDPALDRFNAPLSEYLGTDYSWVWWSHGAKSLRKMMEVAGFDPIDEAARTRAANPLGEFHKIVLRGHAPR